MEEAAIPVAFDMFHQFIYRIRILEPYIAAILYSNIYSVVVCQERREFGEHTVMANWIGHSTA